MDEDRIMTERVQLEIWTTVLLGIVGQLQTTRQEKLFSRLEINRSQFTVLHHFSHTPERSWTVSELAAVMEMNQPGITKIIQRLVAKKMLVAHADAQDSRKKQLKITQSGLNFCSQTLLLLLPDVQQIFADWDDSALIDLEAHLEKLKDWLDNNRDTVILPRADE